VLCFESVTLDEVLRLTSITWLYYCIFRDMYSRKEFLHKCLARSLSMTERMTEGGYLSSVDEHEYVLTLDYVLKMLSIHERYKCGVPVVIQGETGVGKTALVEMYTILMNNAVYDYWKREQGRMKEKLEGVLVLKAKI